MSLEVRRPPDLPHLVPISIHVHRIGQVWDVQGLGGVQKEVVVRTSEAIYRVGFPGGLNRICAATPTSRLSRITAGCVVVKKGTVGTLYDLNGRKEQFPSNKKWKKKRWDYLKEEPQKTLFAAQSGRGVRKWSLGEDRKWARDHQIRGLRGHQLIQALDGGCVAANIKKRMRIVSAEGEEQARCSHNVSLGPSRVWYSPKVATAVAFEKRVKWQREGEPAVQTFESDRDDERVVCDLSRGVLLFGRQYWAEIQRFRTGEPLNLVASYEAHDWCVLGEQHVLSVSRGEKGQPSVFVVWQIPRVHRSGLKSNEFGIPGHPSLAVQIVNWKLDRNAVARFVKESLKLPDMWTERFAPLFESLFNGIEFASEQQALRCLLHTILIGGGEPVFNAVNHLIEVSPVEAGMGLALAQTCFEAAQCQSEFEHANEIARNLANRCEEPSCKEKLNTLGKLYAGPSPREVGKGKAEMK